jgi:NTP pyrophosphatase (non-canonical NTP hydrolase)
VTTKAAMLTPAASERVALVLEVVARATAWLDAHNGRSQHEVTHRILKLVEEVGEVAQAPIGQLGQNPRKGVTHSRDDVAAELADVVVTAPVALHSLDLDPATVLACKARAIAARLEGADAEAVR